MPSTACINCCICNKKLRCIFVLKFNALRTIASEVLDYINKKPFLLSALSQGIINLTSLARQIQPEIEGALKKPAKSGAIVMA